MDAELVPMTKDGETLEVHASCVKAHEQVGWVIAPAAPAAPAEEPTKAGKKSAAKE